MHPWCGVMESWVTSRRTHHNISLAVDSYGLRSSSLGETPSTRYEDTPRRELVNYRNILRIHSGYAVCGAAPTYWGNKVPG